MCVFVCEYASHTCCLSIEEENRIEAFLKKIGHFLRFLIVMRIIELQGTPPLPQQVTILTFSSATLANWNLYFKAKGVFFDILQKLPLLFPLSAEIVPAIFFSTFDEQF